MPSKDAHLPVDPSLMRLKGQLNAATSGQASLGSRRHASTMDTSWVFLTTFLEILC